MPILSPSYPISFVTPFTVDRQMNVLTFRLQFDSNWIGPFFISQLFSFLSFANMTIIDNSRNIRTHHQWALNSTQRMCSECAVMYFFPKERFLETLTRARGFPRSRRKRIPGWCCRCCEGGGEPSRGFLSGKFRSAASSLSQASAAAAACRLQQPAFSAFPRRCVAGKGKEGVLRLDHHRHNWLTDNLYD